MPLSKQQLGSLLCGIEDTGLRGKAEDYKPYILSLLFLKRLSDNCEWETARRINQFCEQYNPEPNEKQLARLPQEGRSFVVPSDCFWRDVRDAPLEDKNDAKALPRRAGRPEVNREIREMIRQRTVIS
ncbi:MAG TPA: type I restriction-modification system subunit M N-terminal domain-containing protein [Terriglobales bacterium]|nr:type I restriction-modification system subunit M N-terminal domain-containing protein [Terriglobales bacterium]